MISIDKHPDGSTVVWERQPDMPAQGIKVTPVDEGVILVTGSGDDHPFDTCPTLITQEGVIALMSVLLHHAGRP